PLRGTGRDLPQGLAAGGGVLAAGAGCGPHRRLIATAASLTRRGIDPLLPRQQSEIPCAPAARAEKSCTRHSATRPRAPSLPQLWRLLRPFPREPALVRSRPGAGRARAGGPDAAPAP